MQQRVSNSLPVAVPLTPDSVVQRDSGHLLAFMVSGGQKSRRDAIGEASVHCMVSEIPEEKCDRNHLKDNLLLSLSSETT